MKALDLLKLTTPSFSAESCKLHLATYNGKDNPIDVFLAGDFDEWQCWQNQKNFQREFVVALLQMPGTTKWLFAGLYKPTECRWVDDHYEYSFEKQESSEELSGRLVVDFTRRGRNSYLVAERWADDILVSEIYPERLSISEFPGYRAIDISKGQLDLIVGQSISSWKSALSSVTGIYLISDTLSGKCYVGSAGGSDGFWSRWSEYSRSGHGGNKELKAILRDEPGRASNFRYSILEIADLDSSEERILARESYWKNILMTRSNGLNSN